MGGSQSSTRKLTVENEDPTSVIKVSDDVVQRLRGNQEVRSKVVPAQQQWPAGYPAGGVPPVPYYYHEPSLTTIQLRQDNVQQLKKNDEYWNNRMRQLEANHKKIHDIMEDEYNKALQEFGENKAKKSSSHLLPPCQAPKEAVVRCYKSNCMQPMECSKLVQAFQDCVESKRNELLASRG